MMGVGVEASVALVLGGSRGIGRAVSLALANKQAKTIIINYLQNDAAAQETKREIEGLGVCAHTIQANLAIPSEIDRLFTQIATLTERVDIMVHCAALGAFKPLSDVKANQWDLSMAVNARSFLLCVQKCLPLMPQGHIVAISSLGGRQAVPNYGAIGVSKAALEAVIRQLANELSPRGIHINGVAGGFVETESITHFPHYQQMMQQAVAQTPTGRLGQPEDIADIVSFLVGHQSRWIQGQIIVADGGFSLS